MSRKAQVLRVVFLTEEQNSDEENLLPFKVSSTNGDYLILEGFEKIEQAISLCLSQINTRTAYQLSFEVEFTD